MNQNSPSETIPIQSEELPRMKIQLGIDFNISSVFSGSGPKAKQSPRQMI